jgi:2'-5' RNA ligase
MTTVADILRKLAETKGVMVSIDIPTGIISKLPDIDWPEGSEIEDESHVSVVLFDDEESLDKERLVSLVWSVCNKYEKMDGKLNGVGRFLECHKEGFHCIYLNFDCPVLSELRNELVETLEGEGYKVSKNHGYTPHMTLAYIPKGENPDLSALKPLEVEVKGISVYWKNDQPVLIPFGDPPIFEPTSKLIRVLNNVNLLKWEEQEHPRANDGRFGTKSGQHEGGKQSTETKRTHARHAENTQIRDLAKEHFKAAAGKVRGAIGPLNRNADAQLVEAMDGYRNIMQIGDPREAFNYFVGKVRGIAGVDDKEIARIALNQRNMYYAKLRNMKMEPRPVKVDSKVEIPDKADPEKMKDFFYQNPDIEPYLNNIMALDARGKKNVRDQFNLDIKNKVVDLSNPGEAIEQFAGLAMGEMIDVNKKIKLECKDKLIQQLTEDWTYAVPKVHVDITKEFQSKQPKEQAELSSKLITGEKINSKSLGGGGEDKEDDSNSIFEDAYNAWMDAQPRPSWYNNTEEYNKEYSNWKRDAPIDKIPDNGFEDSSSSGDHANLAYRITIKDDGRACLKGVTYGGEYGMPQNEVFCYQAATLMGFDIVPPCVYRTDEKLGQCSAQAWIENGILGAETDPIEITDDFLESVSQLAIFDIVLGNRDRHAGNWMYDKDTGRVVGIDNGLVGLDVGRGQMSPKVAVNIAWDRATQVLRTGWYEYSDRKAPDHLNNIINPEHVAQARKFVESPEFIALLQTHFEQEQFQDHLKTRKTTSATYIKRMLKMTQAGLDKLDREIGKVRKVSDLLRKRVRHGKICLVQ